MKTAAIFLLACTIIAGILAAAVAVHPIIEIHHTTAAPTSSDEVMALARFCHERRLGATHWVRDRGEVVKVVCVARAEP